MTETQPALLWVIDDDPDVGEHLRLRLRRSNTAVRIRLLHSAGEVRAAVRTDEAPALVLIDHRLPDGDGLDLVECIREAAPDARLALISAAPEEIPVHDADRLDVLPKPIDAGHINTLLTSIASNGNDDVADS